MITDERIASPRFPRSAAYHPEWIKASVSGGANSLWLTEWLTELLRTFPSYGNPIGRTMAEKLDALHRARPRPVSNSAVAGTFAAR